MAAFTHVGFPSRFTDGIGAACGSFADVRGGWPEVHLPDDYGPAQSLGRILRRQGCDGLVYDSVRLRGAWNLAAFRPRPLASTTGAAHVIQGPHYFLMWDGTRIDRTIEVGQPEWQPLAPAGA